MAAMCMILSGIVLLTSGGLAVITMEHLDIARMNGFRVEPKVFLCLKLWEGLCIAGGIGVIFGFFMFIVGRM